MRSRTITCPYCGADIEVFGNGFYGTYECYECSTDEEPHWFNAFGQRVCSPEQQMMCEDW